MRGAKTAKQHAPHDFHGEIELLHKCCKREHADAWKNGNAQDTATDPVTMALHKKSLKWVPGESVMFAWCWTQQQWNLMAQSAHIDPLKLHNLRLGTNSIMVKHDESKADKQVPRLAPKNFCPNPCDHEPCHFTGLGVCLLFGK